MPSPTLLPVGLPQNEFCTKEGEAHIMTFRWIAAVAAIAAVIVPPAMADELVIRPALGYTGALEGLKAGFEAASGDKIKVAGPDETPDLVIQAKPQVEAQVKEGKVDAGSVTDVAQVRIGFAVKAGAAAPDISTPEKLKAALLAAKSVGLSRFASGQYVSGKLFPALGIADQMKDKIVLVASGPVAAAVAKGEAEVGFQQMSELHQVKGVTVVGRVPESLQSIVVFTAGVGTGTKSAAAAQRFIAYIKSPAVAATYKTLDLEQVK